MCFYPWEASHCRGFCVNVYTSKQPTTENIPQMILSIPASSSTNQPINACPPAPFFIRPQLPWCQHVCYSGSRETHTNKTTHSKWRLELFHLSEEEYGLSMARQLSWQVELSCQSCMRNETTRVFPTSTDVLYMHSCNLVICSLCPYAWRGPLIIAALNWNKYLLLSMWFMRTTACNSNSWSQLS